MIFMDFPIDFPRFSWEDPVKKTWHFPFFHHPLGQTWVVERLGAWELDLACLGDRNAGFLHRFFMGYVETVWKM